MKIVELQQGTKEWLEHRSKYFNASDAPAMLGVSSYISRDELLRQKATGLIVEPDHFTEQRFAEGHRFEALARPVAEQIIGEDLYPVVGVAGKLSASFDGLTMNEDIVWEHKRLNDTLRNAMFDGCTGADLPPQYQIQMQQQCIVSGAEKVLFMASNWDENDNLIEERHCWFTPTAQLAERITHGWSEFEKDLDNYAPTPAIAEVVGNAPDSLPTLFVKLTGEVQSTNLHEFKKQAIEVINSINTNLVTDNDFADAEKTVKWCKEVENKLTAVKDQALGQTVSISELFNAIDDISEKTRATRLMLEKAIKSQKESRRTEYIMAAKKEFIECLEEHNKTLGGHYMPTIPCDFAGAIKGKKTLKSIEDALQTELLKVKSEAEQFASQIKTNLDFLAQYQDKKFLFNDLPTLLLNQSEAFSAIVKERIAEYEKTKQEALEAERVKIRAEEERKAAEKQTAQPTAPAIEQPVINAPQRAAAEVAMIKIGEINSRLGFTVTADFITSLGIPPASKKGAATLYRESDFYTLCQALINHIADVAKYQNQNVG